jgi:hypothetical protein
MPRFSKRYYKLQAMAREIGQREELQFMREIGVLSDDSLEEDIDFLYHAEYEDIQSQRYLFRPSQYRKGKGDEHLTKELGEMHLGEEELDAVLDKEGPPWLNSTDFKEKYRMSHTSFEKLAKLIEDHPIFKNQPFPERRRIRGGGKKQSPPRHQLACFLKYIGTEGSGCSNAGMRQVFRFGRGTFPNFVHRCCSALRSLKKEYVTWPDQDERKEIARRFFENYGLPNCVGISDGTLFPFAFRPETEDAPDYKGRKLGYTLTCMVICDDRRFIRHYLTGWPGSVHDNRIFGMTNLAKMPALYFSSKEYLLGDSAFLSRWFMVPAYKNLPGPGGSLTTEQERFNTCLGSARVVSEHTIGLLKCRFPWLRHIRRCIKKNPKKCM